jgi:hypothetical protein
MVVQELFDYARVAASGPLFATNAGRGVAGFLCTSAGNVGLKEGIDGTGNDIVAPFACVAGTFYSMPFACPLGAYAVQTGGAIGTWALAK